MDALRRKASKFHEQVTRKQLAAQKHNSDEKNNESSNEIYDEAEIQRHEQLDRLYKSTKSRRDFQKDLVKSVETFTTIRSENIEAEIKLSADCCKYGFENAKDEILGEAAYIYGDARKRIEKELEDLNVLMTSQVLDPLRSMITNAALDDAHLLAHRYNRMKQEAGTQASKILKRNTRTKESPSQGNVAKLHLVVGKMKELKEGMDFVGKEATSTLANTELEQGKQTLQSLVHLVEGEKSYYERAAKILGEVESELVSKQQGKEANPPSVQSETTLGEGNS